MYSNADTIPPLRVQLADSLGNEMEHFLQSRERDRHRDTYRQVRTAVRYCTGAYKRNLGRPQTSEATWQATTVPGRADRSHRGSAGPRGPDVDPLVSHLAVRPGTDVGEQQPPEPLAPVCESKLCQSCAAESGRTGNKAAPLRSAAGRHQRRASALAPRPGARRATCQQRIQIIRRADLRSTRPSSSSVVQLAANLSMAASGLSHVIGCGDHLPGDPRRSADRRRVRRREGTDPGHVEGLWSRRVSRANTRRPTHRLGP